MAWCFTEEATGLTTRRWNGSQASPIARLFRPCGCTKSLMWSNWPYERAAFRDQYQLTAYDAAYLELGLRHRLPIASARQGIVESCAKRPRESVRSGVKPGPRLHRLRFPFSGANRVMKLFIAAFVFRRSGRSCYLRRDRPTRRGPVRPNALLADRAIWDECGLKTAETVRTRGAGKTLYRYRLPASGFHRGPGGLRLAAEGRTRSLPRPLPLAAETLHSLIAGARQLSALSSAATSPPDGTSGRVRGTDAPSTPRAFPLLPGYLPSGQLMPNSERYTSGRWALRGSTQGFPPPRRVSTCPQRRNSASSRAQRAIKLTIFRYPTNQMAMQKITEFEKLPDAVAKRSGPLVAVSCLRPTRSRRSGCSRKVRWQADITEDQYVPTRRDNIGDLVINAFILTGILGSWRDLRRVLRGRISRLRWRRGRGGEEPEVMIGLHWNEL